MVTFLFGITKYRCFHDFMQTFKNSHKKMYSMISTCAWSIPFLQKTGHSKPSSDQREVFAHFLKVLTKVVVYFQEKQELMIRNVLANNYFRLTRKVGNFYARFGLSKIPKIKPIPTGKSSI